MRRGPAIVVCLSLVQALCLAQFQHVHTGHGDSVLVHAHWLTASPHCSRTTGPVVEDDDHHHDARSIDTFQIVLAPDQVASMLPAGQVVERVSLEARAPVEIVHECAHDPPCGRQTVPRAPPV